MPVRMETLGQTLDCGQCFRWRRLPDGSWEGAAGPRFARFTAENLERMLSDGFWRNYFDLDAITKKSGTLSAPSTRSLRGRPATRPTCAS